MGEKKSDLLGHLKNILSGLESKSIDLSTVHDYARQMDANLLKILLKDKRCKDLFFIDVDGVLVFNQSAFLQVLESAEMLPNNYTSFLNKIGLNDDRKEFISRKEDVVLVWPYKDCVLEGGQTKEDVRKEEKFYNEILAKEEIDRLLDPKVFTDFKIYDDRGAHIPKDIRVQKNFIIRGNNLLVMHSLKKRFAGKVKLIYIDPPYNTGSDGFVYHDNFSHSTWLTFMKNRLEIAWQLLSEDGCIFIQTDDSEFAYLKVLCDELFGRHYFREHIVIKSSTESGVNAINVKNGERLFKVKENILFYAKSTSFRFKPFFTKAPFNMNYKYEVILKNGKYVVTNIHKQYIEKALKESGQKKLSSIEINNINAAFERHALANSEHFYSLEKNIKKAGEQFKKFASQNALKDEVEEYTNSKAAKVLLYKGGVLVPLKERVIEENGNYYFGVLASDLWLDIGTTAASEGGIEFRNGKKPEKLIRRIIEMTTSPGDLVLDYHLGSGTTAAVAHKLGRNYIGIEQMDYGENDSVVRLQNVIKGDTTGISKGVQWQGGGSFLYMKMNEWNEYWIKKIVSIKTKKAAVKLLTEILEKGFINYFVDEEALKKEHTHFEDFELEEQKKTLFQMLDKNLLYVPYSEMSDKEFAISKHDQLLNNQFYHNE